MSRRISPLRFARPSRHKASGVVGAVLLVSWLSGAWLVNPASAEEEISVQPDELIFADPGSITAVASEQVPAELVGQSCDLRVVAVNGSSIHVGNTLIVTTGDSRTVIPGVEDSPDGSTIGNERVTLGSTINFELEMGQDGMSSLGFTVGFDCPEPEPEASNEASSTQPDPTVLPSQQEAPTTTAAPAAALPEAEPARATVGNPSFTG